MSPPGRPEEAEALRGGVKGEVSVNTVGVDPCPAGPPFPHPTPRPPHHACCNSPLASSPSASASRPSS